MGSSYEEVAAALHAGSVAFNGHLTNLKEINDVLLGKSAEMVEALKALGSSGPREPALTTCNVCFSRPRTHVLTPCGHAGFCESCAGRAHSRNRCHVCRGRVLEIFKIYL